MRRAALTAAGSLVLFLGLLTVLLLGGGVNRDTSVPCTPLGSDLARASSATPATGPGGLDAHQVAYAVAVFEEAARRGLSERAVVLAYAVIAQESGWRMFANDGTGQLAADQAGVDRSLEYPHDAVGRDHGSVGLFQQQWPWWGTFDDLMDPARSAGLFFDALAAVEGWEAMPLTEAAQAVQRSAFPTAYADDEATARELASYVAQLAPGIGLASYDATGGGGPSGAAAGRAGCVEQLVSASAGTCPPTGLPVEAGLTPDALLVLRCVDQAFGRFTYHGVGPRGNASDHSEGRAVDVMIPDYSRPAGIAAGDRIAQWVIGRPSELGVTYVIWRARIWSSDRAGEGWRPYAHPAGRADDSARHLDHVHVSVAGSTGTGLVAAGGTAWPIDPSTPGVSVRDNFGRAGSLWSGGRHTGTDFSAPLGTPVRAVHAGVVRIRTDQAWAGPWLVAVETGTGRPATWYAHMSAVTVSDGDVVQAGQQLGAVGSEGNSTGPHLHLELRPTGSAGPASDPIPWLRGEAP